MVQFQVAAVEEIPAGLGAVFLTLQYPISPKQNIRWYYDSYDLPGLLRIDSTGRGLPPASINADWLRSNLNFGPLGAVWLLQVPNSILHKSQFSPRSSNSES